MIRSLGFIIVASVLAAGTARADSVPILSAAADRPDQPGLFFRLDVKLSDIPANEFRVALSVSDPICLQPMVHDFIWVAAFAASRTTGKPLSGRCVQVHLSHAMRGTSAGLAIAMGIAEALEGRTLPTDFAVTGEILPNGLVGPVQGMPSKISAAAKAGIRRVAIPMVPRTENVDGKEVDPVDWGRRLGVEVVRVRTLSEALSWMARKPLVEPATDERAVLAPPSAAEAELTRQATNLLARLVTAGVTNSIEEVRAELKAGRFFSARQLATLGLAQRMAERKVPPPEPAATAVDRRIGDWISPELLGLEEKLRQESEQDAPPERLEEGRSFVAWLKRLQTEQAAALIGVCGGGKPKPDDLSAMAGVSYALADLFEQTSVSSIATVRGRSIDRMYQMLYPVDPTMLIWKLTLMRLQHEELTPTHARLAWAIARGSAVIARFGGGLQICEDRKTETLSVAFGCDDYLDEYVDESRKAALAAIADERVRGGFPALAIDSFERGERLRDCAKSDLQNRLSAFESYLRSYLLCGGGGSTGAAALLAGAHILFHRSDAIDVTKSDAKKADTAWMPGSVGVSVHWTAGLPRAAGPATTFEEAVNGFDVPRFVDAIASVGARHLIFTTAHAYQMLPMPNAALDAIAPGRTTKRDLFGEILDACAAKGIRVIAYYNHSCNGEPEPEAKWLSRDSVYARRVYEWMRICRYPFVAGGDAAVFASNYCAIVRDISGRYGTKISGWWFDSPYSVDTRGPYVQAVGDWKKSPTGSGWVGADGRTRTFPWADLVAAAKSGNPRAAVAVNAGCGYHFQYTDLADYCAGEVASFDETKFPAVPRPDLVDTRWACVDDRAWTFSRKRGFLPLYKSVDYLVDWTREQVAARRMVTFNVLIDRDGNLSPVLKELKPCFEMPHRH